MEDRQYVFSSSPASDYTCEVFIYTPVGIRMIGLIKKSYFFLEISLDFFSLVSLDPIESVAS